MKSKIKNSGNIKIIVLIGYVVLFTLPILGLYQINRQLVKFSEYKNPYVERKELNFVSNALVSLYKSESIRKVMLSDEFYTPSFKSIYSTLNDKTKIYIDSLYAVSEEDEIRQSIDTVKMLLHEKDENLVGMLALMDSIRKLPYSKVLKTAVLSHKNINDLNKMISAKMVTTKDSSYYIKEKRSFIDRVRAVFSNKEDSTKIVSSKNTVTNDSAFLKPADVLTDTIVQYINDINSKSDKRKIAYLTRLSSRQNEMLYYDELLTNQISAILRGIESKEKELAVNLINEKQAILKKSSHIVSNIGFSSLLALIAFITLSFLLINRGQAYRRQLEESKKTAEDLSKSRERLLLMMSHDVKAPLSSIIGHIELLSNEKLSETERSHLNNMRNSSEQILELSKKLLDYHRLEQGKSEVNNAAFSPYQLIEDTYNSFIPIASKKNLHFTLTNDLEKSELYESDPLVFRQVLNNLMNNAIKFTVSGGVYVQSSLDKNKSLLTVSVKDTGPGINDEDKKKIFTDFGRGGSLESRHQIEGSGLGLAITKKLVEQMNGKIHFASEIGKGTEFTLTVPLKFAGVKKPIPKMDNDSNYPVQQPIECNVLFVDDDVAMLNVYSKLMEREGAKVKTCSESKNVLSLLADHPFDIIFTDIQMPDMNGFELVKKIRSAGGRFAEIPIIALSASSETSEENFKTAGFTGFLPKPVPFDVLLKILRRAKKTEFTNATSEKYAANGISALIEFVEDDKDTSIDILTTFIEENNQKIRIFADSLKNDDWDAVKSTAHKLLPLMRMIDDQEMVNMLAALESGVTNRVIVEKLIPLIEKKNKEALDFIQIKFGNANSE